MKKRMPRQRRERVEMYSHEKPSMYQPPSPSSLASSGTYRETIVNVLTDRRIILESALSQLAARASTLADAASLLVRTLRAGHKVLVAGNGGSAAEAQHFVAELIGRFKRERSAYAALALTADSAILTAIANDYSFQDVFARQIQGLGQPDDIFVAFSTSGESENLVRAVQMAHQCSMDVIAITGNAHSRLEALSDITVRVPGVDTATAQELHMMVTHILCDIAETQLASCPTTSLEAPIAEDKEGNLQLLISHGKENEW